MNTEEIKEKMYLQGKSSPKFAVYKWNFKEISTKPQGQIHLATIIF